MLSEILQRKFLGNLHALEDEEGPNENANENVDS